MNKQKGNMYPFVTHTWNPIKGTCPHQCSYCYVPSVLRGQPWGELRLDGKALKENLGQGNFIFVGSSTDMWAYAVPFEWLTLAVRHCYAYPKNRYLFQSKNPARFSEFDYPNDMNIILGTTIETNRDYSFISKAPATYYRKVEMARIDKIPKMVSIEPILDFDVPDMIAWMHEIQPEFVSIGADSKNHHLPEPPAYKVKALIDALQEITTVKLKDNLNRLWDKGG